MSEMLRVTREGAVAQVVLNRPERNNAFDEALIAALFSCFSQLSGDAAISVVAVSGEGRSFCAGADIAWMKRAAGYSREENVRDTRPLAQMLAALDAMPQTTIARVHGPVYGGGIGLVAACDIAIADEHASFCLSEVRLGLVPAVISPYVLRAIGARAAHRYFQTAEVFTARQAERIGLVHEVVRTEHLTDRIDDLVTHLLGCAPSARAESKKLVSTVAGRPVDESLRDETARLIADVRVGDEAREGLAAFLEKRKPSWMRQ
ncbi:enoyl-CoA hydratase/isomerase family protein [Bradyrhizobium sp. 14AA]